MKNKIINTSLVCGLLLTSMPVSAMTKDETVYSKLNIDGSVNSITVNEHLINDEKIDTISDLTNLTELINNNGSEDLKLSDNKLTIKSNGKDIYYQGKSKEELPIGVSIKYELDGKDIVLKDLLGKSGKVKMIINYTNNDAHLVNGSTLYTPFVVVTTLSLDSKNNSNITVSSGKVVSTGTKDMIAAISTPGLSDSLGITKIDVLNKVEITFDTTNYESSSLYIVATPKVLEDSDLDVFNKLDSLYSKVNELTKSSSKIEDGAKELATGAVKISDSSKLISTNLNSLSTYIADAKDGSIKLDNGINTILNTIIEKSSSLNNPDDANKLAQIQNLIKTNNTAITKLNVSQESLNFAYTYYHLDKVNIEDLTNEQLKTVKLQYESNASLIALLEGNNTALASCLTTLIETSTNVNNTLSTLVAALTELSKGSNELVNGLTSISEGSNLLASKTNEFVAGTTQLSEGANTLSEGVKSFNEQGINKIGNFINNDLANYQDKVESLIKLSNDYNTFTMKTDDMEGTTKFIMSVDKVNADSTKTSVKEIKTESKSLWQKIKDLFK